MGWFKKDKKEKRNPYKVIVYFDDLAGNKIPQNQFEREIIIPDGYTFKYGFAQRPRLLNRNGEVVWMYDWKAGYEITYEFFYD